MASRIEQVAQKWLSGFLFPFRQPDWLEKMWLVAAIGFVLTPFVQVIALQGWRVELIRRIAVGEPRVLPPAGLSAVFRYFGHGIKLWFIAGVYIAIPWIILRLLGAHPFALIYEGVSSIGGHVWNSIWGKPNAETFSVVLWAQFWNVVRAILYNAAWLAFYYPYYKTASLRYALTGKMRRSHWQIRANIAYMLRGLNFLSLLSLIWQLIMDKLALIFLTFLLSLILTPFFTLLIVPILFYANYWTSGYDQGHKGKSMVEQEYPHLQVVSSPPTS